MANYNLQMTGAQIKTALMMLVNRIAEGWAVGTYDGAAVDPSSEFYHNNAKYYAALAQSAVPPGETGAVKWDQDQSETLTAAQKEVARKNIMAGGTNPNLLDNGWFLVNQRGQNSYTGVGYSVDRWRTSSPNNTITVDTNGITIGADRTYGFNQRITSELNNFLLNKTVTFSILNQDGTIGSRTFVWPETNSPEGSISGTTIYAGGTQGISQGISLLPSSQISIRAVKLELGSVSTLANDALPNYAEELAKCQRYFRRFRASSGGATFIGVCQSDTIAVFPNIFNSPQMRANPTVTFGGTLNIRKIASTNVDYAISAVSMRHNPPAISLEATSSGMTKGDLVVIMFGAGGEISFSADL